MSLEDVLSRELHLAGLCESVSVLAELRAGAIHKGRSRRWSCGKRRTCGRVQRAESDAVQHVEDFDRYLELLLFEDPEGLGETGIH